MSDPRTQALRFRALRDKRAEGPLSPEEERELQRLGQALHALRQSRTSGGNELPKQKVIGSGQSLRGQPLPGCDFFDDFPNCTGKKCTTSATAAEMVHPQKVRARCESIG